MKINFPVSFWKISSMRSKSMKLLQLFRRKSKKKVKYNLPFPMPNLKNLFPLTIAQAFPENPWLSNAFKNCLTTKAQRRRSSSSWWKYMVSTLANSNENTRPLSSTFASTLKSKKATTSYSTLMSPANLQPSWPPSSNAHLSEIGSSTSCSNWRTIRALSMKFVIFTLIHFSMKALLLTETWASCRWTFEKYFQSSSRCFLTLVTPRTSTPSGN